MTKMSILMVLFLLFLQLSHGIQSLSEPDTYILHDGGHYYLNVDYCTFNVDGINPFDNSTEEEESLLSFTSRCFCWYNKRYDTQKCSIPGPTLIIYSGTSIDLTLTNNLIGANSNHSLHNLVKDPDVINLHTHGLHIDPFVDDVLIEILPSESHTYKYVVPKSHYPGQHWYHGHHHGSTAFHLQGGLFGSLIVKYKKLKEEKYYDKNLLNMKSYKLAIHWIWAWTVDGCDCDEPRLRIYGYRNGDTRTFAYCWIWCSFDIKQTEISGTEYDFTGLNDYEFWLINKQLQPIINDGWLVNEYRILQFLGSLTEMYAQLYFNPYENSGECEYYLISRDGIYFKNGHRNLCDSPTFCYLIIPPGGRAEVIMTCKNPGIYEIKTSTTNIYQYLTALPRTEHNVTLLSVQIEDDDSSSDSHSSYSNYGYGNNNKKSVVTELPNYYPKYPNYLKSLLDEDNEQILNYPLTDECPCYNFDELDTEFEEGTCGWDVFTRPRLINGLGFNKSISQYYVQKDTIYEFFVAANIHPMHQHVNPFQPIDDVGYGLLGEKGDWFDTLGHSFNFSYRTITLDFNGVVIYHCHILIHEDEGMMTYYTIVDDLNEDTCEFTEPIHTLNTCEFTKTVYAHDNPQYSSCFNNYGFNEWGWSNGPYYSDDFKYGSIILDLYAGAGQCNVNNGKSIGILEINYDKYTNTYIITYKANKYSKCKFEEFHLYVGNDELPTDNNGDYTVSPGHFPVVSELGGDETCGTFTHSDTVDDPFYVVAHATVCCGYDNNGQHYSSDSSYSSY